MAIPELKNGHFEEIGGWLQILQIVGNSTLFYLSFDTHDMTALGLLSYGNGKFLALISLCAVYVIISHGSI